MPVLFPKRPALALCHVYRIPYTDVYRCYIPLPRFGIKMTHLEGQLDITPLICDLMFEVLPSSSGLRKPVQPGFSHVIV